MGTWRIPTGVIVSALMAAICLGDTVTSVNGPLIPDSFPYSENLDPNYRLQWNFNTTHIMFKTTVKTTGFIGFGISDHGQMVPSDVIIGWVKDGEVHFKDRHAVGYYMPSVDISQDWHLVSGSEDGEYTTLIFVRQFDTCDEQDKVITSGTTRVIFSYNPADPPSDDDIQYHGNTRGTKSILLLDPPANENAKDNLPADVTTIDFLNKNYSVPSASTTYSCVTFKLPPLNGKHHMIRYEPMIQKGHEKLVHHMLFYFCRPGYPDSMIGDQYLCYDDSAPDVVEKNCNHVIISWAIGGTAFDFPAHVGYPLGGIDDPVYFRLETHYNNPNMRSDFVDSSGLKIFLTQELRQHDAGMLEVGVNIDTFHIIPPHYEQFLSRGFCNEKCLEEALGDDEIYIFADLLHSHLLGTQLVTRLIRNGTELAPILQDDNFDFDFQEMRLLRQERTVRKGDTLITDCYFDTTKRSTITYGGLSTREEMCLSFIFYYPQKQLSSCHSRPLYDVGSKSQDSIFHTTNIMDFTNETIRDQFVGMIREDEVLYSCQEKEHYNYVDDKPPEVDHPYTKEDHCKND